MENMATTGMKTFNSTGEETQKIQPYRPPEPKIYEARLDASAVSTAVAKDGRPYVTGARFVLSGTAQVEGGRDKHVTHIFWLGTQKGDKGGKADVYRSGGLVSLARALGEEITDVGTVDQTLPDGRNYEALNANDVKAWLQAHDGRVLSLKTGLRAGDKTDELTGKPIQFGTVAFFVEQSGGAVESQSINISN